MMESQLLKPCPFCGEQGIMYDENYRTCYIECANCGASTATEDSEMSATDAWNRRYRTPG